VRLTRIACVCVQTANKKIADLELELQRALTAAAPPVVMVEDPAPAPTEETIPVITTTSSQGARTDTSDLEASSARVSDAQHQVRPEAGSYHSIR
jgi:hypothetical protein